MLDTILTEAADAPQKKRFCARSVQHCEQPNPRAIF